jgi:hypothetical protein
MHMIVPGAGLSNDGQRWIACRPTFFLPVRVLSRLFRRLFLKMLAAAHASGRLEFFGQHSALADHKAFAAFVAPLCKTEWVVYAKEPFGGPQAVLAYLSRYTHRVAISNSRLISADETGVTFKWKDYLVEDPGRYKTMTLPTHEFIRRFLMHVLPNALNATDEPRVLPQPCPCCGGRMIIIETFARGCKPKHQPTIQEITIDTS